MKKEVIAGAVLALLIALSAWNIYSIDALTDGIGDSLRMSQALADGYTHIFLRHPEIDSTTDAFYELQELLLDGGGDGCAAAYDKLRYHLESIRSMEHISIGSVL